MQIETGERENDTSALLAALNGLNDAASKSVYFRFSLEQDIKITALKLPARIVGRGERPSGHIYLVVWWAENKRYEAWLYEHELEG